MINLIYMFRKICWNGNNIDGTTLRKIMDIVIMIDIQLMKHHSKVPWLNSLEYNESAHYGGGGGWGTKYMLLVHKSNHIFI